MLFTDVIAKKRDGHELTAEEIKFFVAGLTDASIPAEQVSAFAMAVFLNSMTAEEAGQLTTAMTASGAVLQWDDLDLDGPIVDKHSTGGIGDKVSFLLAPIAAACGCYVPMISGRGLGHTGGTTDKVESIPGYQSMPDYALFRKVVKDVGCAIIGQTEDLAPADRRFYSIRDVTATVESIPLITASILSKKIAAGLSGLVMDVKYGSGAFMSTMSQAEEMATSIINTAAAANLKTHALITDMNECLGEKAGNALEIAESMEFLSNTRREPRLNAVVMATTAEMLVVTGIESNRDAAMQKTDEAVTSGKAAEIFEKMVRGLGGPADFVMTYAAHLPKAPVTMPVFAKQEGVLAAVDAFALGNAIIELGGGRRELNDVLDLSVGFADMAPIGEVLDGQRPLGVIHAADEVSAKRVFAMFQNACTVADAAPESNPVIYKILT